MCRFAALLVENLEESKNEVSHALLDVASKVPFSVLLVFFQKNSCLLFLHTPKTHKIIMYKLYRTLVLHNGGRLFLSEATHRGGEGEEEGQGQVVRHTVQCQQFASAAADTAFTMYHRHHP